jgi:ABC-type transport system substrate-binding protein
MKKKYILLAKLFKIFIERKTIDIIVFGAIPIGLMIIFFTAPKFNLPKPEYEGIYREALYESVQNLNPLSTQNDSEKTILNIIYPPLIEFDNGKIISKYIKNYYFSPDKLTLTIELKDNLKWSDGSKITPDDIKFSFETFKKAEYLETFNYFKNINLEIIDSQKIQFKLTFNDNYFLYRLNSLRILPQKTFSSVSGDENFNLQNLKIGSGPFIFESMIKKNKITVINLKRNEYYLPKPYLEKISFIVYPSLRRALDALILKEVDGLAGLNYTQLPKNIFLNYNLHKIALPRIIGIFFNSEEVNEKEIEFLNQKINRKEINHIIFNNFAEESKEIFSPTVKKIWKIPPLTIKPSKNGLNKLNFEIITISSYFYPDIARYLKEKFNINFTLIKPDDLFRIIESKNYQSILYGLEYSHPPEIFSFFSSLGYNINNIKNLNLEKKFQSLLSDPQKNITDYLIDIEKEIISLNKNIFLLNPYYLYFINKKFSGFDQIYLNKPYNRFVKIELWYQSK